MSFSIPTQLLTQDQLLDCMKRSFPDCKVSKFGIGPGRRVVVAKDTFTGVDVRIRKGMMVFEPSIVPTRTSFFTAIFSVSLCLVPGLIIIYSMILPKGKKMIDEIADRLENRKS